MSTHPPHPRRVRLRATLRGWLIAWLVLTSMGLVLHWAVWLDPSRGTADAVGERVVIKMADNAQHMLTLPAWGVMNVIRNRWGMDGLGWSALALALGWGAIVYMVNVVVRLRKRLRARKPPGTSAPAVDMSRRRLVFDVAVGGVGLAAGAAGVRGVMTEPWDLQVRRYTIPVRDLPPTLEGFRIAQVSDTHLGPRIAASYVRSAVEATLALRPDLIALTGDYIHMGTRYIDLAASLFRPFTSGARAVPVVGTLGNHDWWGNGPAMSLALSRIGVEMIDNARVFLRASDRRLVYGAPPPGEGICIAGLGDLREQFVDPWGAMAGVPPDMARLVLAHNPDTAEEIEIGHRPPPRIDLMLSGHTHGGQIRIPGMGTPFIPSRYGQKYAGGVVEGPHCRVLVSRGVGMSIFPVRLGVAPEVVEITLARA